MPLGSFIRLTPIDEAAGYAEPALPRDGGLAQRWLSKAASSMLHAITVVLLFSLAGAAGAANVSVSVDRAGCTGDQPNAAESVVSWTRMSSDSIVVTAWDTEEGGCMISDGAGELLDDGDALRLRYVKKCPQLGEPAPVCIEFVRVKYVVTGLRPGKQKLRVRSTDGYTVLDVDG